MPRSATISPTLRSSSPGGTASSATGTSSTTTPPAPRPFEREIAVSLLGLETPGSDWQDQAFDHLAEKCTYLIHVRGYAAWTL